jgi:single-stranded-DNA-specific exonuclease
MALLPKITELLSKRGITGDEVARFLHPRMSDLPDPLALRGMTEARDRVRAAIDNGESVLIFGDYDADGVCAAAILYLYLQSEGADVNVFIPDRSDGYGLSEETVERAAEEFSPDLFITVDCGVSCAGEVAYILDLGIDVIVTDHHEPPEALPDCIVVNPKVKGQDVYCHFCGAGVAFLLAAALGGIQEASRYIDIVAAATVADMVPLTDCNRVLVTEGLKRMNAAPRPAFKALMAAAGAAFPLSAVDLAFKLAPRLNSAGRMGRAGRAFDLLTAGGPDTVESLARELEGENEKRKAVSETVFQNALAGLKKSGEPRFSPYILAEARAGDKGLAGIVAARLAGLFGRPAFLICEGGEGVYRGASRSAGGVNMHALLTYASDCLEEFGGHAQAAGFTVRAEKLPAFRDKAAEYLRQNPADPVAGRREYDLDIEAGEITEAFVRQLSGLEPFGTGNPVPRFRLAVGKTAAREIKKGAPHVQLCAENGPRLTGFNCLPLADLYVSDTRKDLFLELSLSEYKGSQEISALIRGTDAPRLGADLDNDKTLCRYVDQYAYGSAGHFSLSEPVTESPSKVLNSFDALVEKFKETAAKNPCGIVVLASSYASYERFLKAAGESAKNFIHEYIHCFTQGNENRIVLAPAFDFEAAFYHTVFFLDPPFDVRAAARLAAEGCAVYAPAAGQSNPLLARLAAKLDLSRENMGRYYRIFIADGGAPADPYAHFTLRVGKFADIDPLNFYAARAVFQELGLLSVSDNKLVVEKAVKTDLSNSGLYKKLASL